MRYKVAVAYNGTNYVGFQRQKNGLAIQEVIEDKLAVIFHDAPRIVMASRTDSGVHAYHQIFHFDSEDIVEGKKLKASLNALLPRDIRIKEAVHAAADFHARFDVISKTYEYHINLIRDDPFLNDLAYQCPYRLDFDLLEKGTRLFVGTHDFGSFTTNSYEDFPDQKRTITAFTMRVTTEGLLIFTITGDGFMRYMVRMIVGSLVDLGRGQKTLDDLKDMIDHPRKEGQRFNIDPCGLYLKDIRYPGDL